MSGDDRAMNDPINAMPEHPSSATDIVSEAMASPGGRMHLERTKAHLSDAFGQHRFNTEHAIESFSTAIHSAVWDLVRRRPDGRERYRDFKRSHVARGLAEDLAERFKQETGAHDQRRARRFLRFLLGP
jgi:hypothetical protein